MSERLKMRLNKSKFPSIKLNEWLLDAVKPEQNIPSSQTMPDQGLTCIHTSLQPKLGDEAEAMVLFIFRRSCQLAATATATAAGRLGFWPLLKWTAAPILCNRIFQATGGSITVQ